MHIIIGVIVVVVIIIIIIIGTKENEMIHSGKVSSKLTVVPISVGLR